MSHDIYKESNEAGFIKVLLAKSSDEQFANFSSTKNSHYMVIEKKEMKGSKNLVSLHIFVSVCV